MEKAGRFDMEYFLTISNRPTALFACNDLVAKGALEVIKDAGLSVPDDFALVGYDNLDFSSILDVPLTTVAQPGYEMGQAAAKLLMDKIRGNDEKSKKIILKSKLIVRSSSVFRASQKKSSIRLWWTGKPLSEGCSPPGLRTNKILWKQFIISITNL